MASGFSSAVGFKNGTDGNVKIAIQALQSVASPHNFVSIHPDGRVAVVRTNGNPHTHLILRGGKQPNFDAESIARYEAILNDKGYPARIMVDCSHANSGKIAANQPMVLESVADQIAKGNQSIMGVMIESNINHGKQSIPANRNDLEYGVSVTDECLGWEATAEMLRGFRNKIKGVL